MGAATIAPSFLCRSSTCLFQSPARNGRLYAIVLYSFSQKKSRGFHEVPGSPPVPASPPCPSFCTIGRQNRNAEFQSTKKQAFSACFALFSPVFPIWLWGRFPLFEGIVQYDIRHILPKRQKAHPKRGSPRRCTSTDHFMTRFSPQQPFQTHPRRKSPIAPASRSK